ncbi:MAG: tRNA preQ1(34) S-adenosylmethionine ribosyltransferase-isomerase QueA [Clostridia bacterium]|nr:tRNA preQ1(34) S-adenosylmethionine ribosyltransferase-isomerase QueA [Clostridia bacterium]
MKNTMDNTAEIIRNQLPETSLHTSDFSYALPEELIAQHPAEPRDSARLMVINRDKDTVEHRIFSDIIEYLNPGDTLVINDSKVIPARVFGYAEGRHEAGVELLLLRQRGDCVWETLVKPGKRARVGMRIVLGDGLAVAEVTDIVEEGNRLIHISFDRSVFSTVYELLEKIGTMPLPPYITEKQDDYSTYQTVYAREEGSAADPTAGLQFTGELLDRIKAKGIAVVPVMLHVGLGTFRPVKEDDIADHIMHTEYIQVTEAAADIINSRRAAGGRTVCVGTTSCRTLESAAGDDGIVRPVSGDTGIFIYPGYKFKAVDALITNFHLPQSTLLMLVSALYTREKMLGIYNEAVREKYRFFSYGDAMFIQ